MPFDHGLGASVQMARARVVAEARPEFEHVAERRRREGVHVRPACSKPREVRHDRLDGRLLQHDFGEPHAIGIRPLAWRGAPGKHAAMAVVPGEEVRAARLHAVRCALSPLHFNC